jgi:hypothetical protein
MLRRVLPLLFLPFAIVAAAQTASDFATRYGDPDVERFVIRPKITLMVAYAPDRTGCQMIVQPKRPILKKDNESELIARDMVPEMLDELLPESAKESLLTNIEQVVGCDVQVLTTLYNVTINASHERACHTSERGVANVLIVRKNEHCGAPPTRSDSSSEVSIPQTAVDLHTRYGAPDAQRYVVRPGITLMVTYDMDEFACQMVVEPTTSIIHHDEPAKYMRPEVVTEVLEEVLPEAERGALILRTVTKSGCNDYENIDYQYVTVSRFRHNCRLPNPEIEGAATITRKNLCSNGGK